MGRRRTPDLPDVSIKQDPLTRIRHRGRGCFSLCLMLSACGGGGDAGTSASSSGSMNEFNGDPNSSDPVAQISKSTAPIAPVDKSFHAASRFLEHASFGPTPTDVAALKDGRFSAWIDDQIALPVTPIETASIRVSTFDSRPQYDYLPTQLFLHALSAPDQLRLRTSWALIELFVVSQNRVSGYAQSEYFNLLRQQAFGKYKDLLRSIAMHATMGFYQDNVLNRRAGAYPGATPNENFAREVMQLFSIGLIELNLDGTPRLDATGKQIPTYTQAQVEDLARALTGWDFDDVSASRPITDFGNFSKPLVANASFHDTDAKRIVGNRLIAAGGSAQSDLEAIVDTLAGHPNTAPFISSRLIQHLVTGEPSPAYVARAAQVFRDTDGDLGKVVKAILLDAEARAGDDPAAASRLKGKVREPVLGRAQLLRAFGCKRPPSRADDTAIWSPGQFPFTARNVFNFYPPGFKFPGTTVTAPEAKLLSGSLFQFRSGEVINRIKYASDAGAGWRAAGCDNTAWDAANDNVDDAVSLISKRLFRDAMPVYLRDAIKVGIYRRNFLPETRIYDALGLALISPSWGVMK